MMRITKAINSISVGIGRAVSFLMLPMILVIVYLVVMRYFFHKPPIWGFEISVFIYGLYMILPGSFCLSQKAHVAVDILPTRSSPRTQKYLSILSSIVVLFVSVIITYISTKWAWQSTLIREHSIHQTPFNPPIWWFKWAVPISACLLALQAFGDLLTIFVSPHGINSESTTEVIDDD